MLDPLFLQVLPGVPGAGVPVPAVPGFPAEVVPLVVQEGRQAILALWLPKSSKPREEVLQHAILIVRPVVWARSPKVAMRI